MPEEDKKKFEILTILELTAAGLEGYFETVNKGSYNKELKFKIDKEFGDFNRLFFGEKGATEKTENLWKLQDIGKRPTPSGKYCLLMIGNQLIKTDDKEKRIKAGLKYIIDNLISLEGFYDRYEKLENAASKNLYEFFGSLARKMGREADEIKFPTTRPAL